MTPDDRIPGGSNYGTPLPDEVNGVEYITDQATGYRLYHHAPCRICGVREWRWSRRKRSACMAHKNREANDNIEPGEGSNDNLPPDNGARGRRGR